MEKLFNALKGIGINDQTIAKLQADDDVEDVRNYCLILIAMYDDRHEYI